MPDMRMQPYTITVDGVDYPLVCNFNVLADIEDEYGTVFAGTHDEHTFKFARFVLASMLNEACVAGGIEKEWTPREVGRKLPAAGYEIGDLLLVVIKLIADAMPHVAEPDPAEDAPKN